MKPNEIFGFPIDNQTKAAKNILKKHFCKFLDDSCDKQSRTIAYPMGVCSILHGENKPIICPHRFLENNTVFTDVCQEIWGNTHNVLLFSEIKLQNVGSFDFVLVKHKPLSSKIEDFCVVEFQSDSTTGTGQLVEALKDFIENKELKEKYSFGLNTYNTIKLSYIQMLVKGQLLEKWNKHIFWIMQSYVYENMTRRFCLTEMDYDFKKNTKYFLYDLERENNLDILKLQSRKATTINNLLKAFTHQPTPSLDDFVEVLENKIRLKVGLQFG